MKRAIFAAICVVGISSPVAATPIAPDHHLPLIVGVPRDVDLSHSNDIDVPHHSWCYEAYYALISANLIGRRPGNGLIEPMTRYEFTVGIARLLENLHAPYGVGLTQEADDALEKLVEKEAKNLSSAKTARGLTDLIVALRREFAAETWWISRGCSDEWDLVYGKQ